MANKILSLIIGFIFALIVLIAIEELGHSIFPIPKNLNYNDAKEMKNFIKTLPIMAYFFVLLAHFSSAFIGSIITSLISKTNGILGLSIGFLVLMGAVVNIIILPYQPTWFVIADIFFTFIGAWIAFKIAFNVFYNSQY